MMKVFDPIAEGIIAEALQHAALKPLEEETERAAFDRITSLCRDVIVKRLTCRELTFLQAYEVSEYVHSVFGAYFTDLTGESEFGKADEDTSEDCEADTTDGEGASVPTLDVELL